MRAAGGGQAFLEALEEALGLCELIAGALDLRRFVGVNRDDSSLSRESRNVTGPRT